MISDPGPSDPGPRTPDPDSGRAWVAVLLSGRGSNFEALADACARGDVPATIVLVLSDRPDAAGVERARERGIPTRTIARRGLGQLEQERQMVAAIRDAGAQWVCLAGYMRILGRDFVSAFPGRILNIHPALLPAYPGLDAQRQAFHHGAKISGCTVHFVDSGCDTGPIVVQRGVEVLDTDSVESLAARILAEEHRAYAEALRMLLTRHWRLEGRRVVFE